MTFKDLKKRITLEIPQQQYKLFDRLRNKPFWIWNIEEHKGEDIKTNGECCFNHGSQMCIVTGPRIMILEKDDGRIAINPDKFDKLITAIRTAVDNDGTLDKESTSYNDIFDAFRLALKFYHFEEIT